MMKRVFRTEVRVQYADTDAMGVVHHANYIRWFEVGRTELMRELGFPYAELERIPVWIPIAQVSCDYKKPARYDDVVEVASVIADLGHASVCMSYEITNKATGEILATGFSRHGVTNDKLKPVALVKVCPGLYEALKESAAE